MSSFSAESTGHSNRIVSCKIDRRFFHSIASRGMLSSLYTTRLRKQTIQILLSVKNYIFSYCHVRNMATVASI
jgi:hypothetical protein